MQTASGGRTERGPAAGGAAFSARDGGGMVEPVTRQESTTLLREARGGSSAALDDLYRRVGGRLLALIRLKMGRDLRSRLDSADILQATLMRSFERFDQFEGSDSRSLMAWLARIAQNEIRDQVDFQHRRRRDAAAGVPFDGAESSVAAPGPSALTRAVLNERAARLERALDQLAPDHREVIVLRKLEDSSFREIADRMGRSEDACRMLLARALTALTLALRAGS